MHHGNDLGVGVGVEQVLGIKCPAPFGIHPDNRGAAARGNIAHPLAEHAVDADDDGVAGAQHVHDGGFHAG